MIHHLLFSDTLILDAMFPIYLIWDSVFGFNFYQPYIKPLPISLRTDEFPWGMLIFYTYGYLMSFAFTVYLPLVLVGDTLKGKLNKKIFFMKKKFDFLISNNVYGLITFSIIFLVITAVAVAYYTYY